MKLGRCVFLVPFCTASIAFADARISTSLPPAPPSGILVYAQAAIDSLSESDLRRLLFYAKRATGTLQDVVTGADERSIIEQDKVNKRFRESISRLVDAGARSGLSLEQVAGFYTQIVAEEFGQDFMEQVGALAGGLDFNTLFRNVSTVPDPRTSNFDSGADFLNALAQASEGLTVSGAVESADTVQTAAPAGPVPAPNATAEERAIVDRVRVNNGTWEITVERGDSLALLAAAIYGDAQSFNTIYQANRDILNDPSILNIGLTLRIPKP